LIAAAFTWVFSRMVRNGLHPLLAGLLTVSAVVAAAFHFYARPHLATIAGMVVTMAFLVDYDRGRAGPWRLWWLIPLNIVWTNIHGGVLGGVFTLGLAVGGWTIISLWQNRKQHSWRTTALLLGIVACCGLTPFVNPFGLEMLHTWKRIVGSTAMKELVSEHQPLSLASSCGQVVVGYAAFYIIALLGTLPAKPRIVWLLPLVWFGLSLQSIRQGPLFAAVGAVVLADIWPHTVWHRLLKKYGDSLAREIEPQQRSWHWAATCSVLVAVALALQATGVRLPVVGSGWAGLDSDWIPTALADELQQYRDTKPAGTRLFNDANLGGFVIYHAPGLPVFMDDRFELYGDAFLRDYVRLVYDHPEEFDDWVQKFHIDAVLLTKYPEGHRLALEVALRSDPNWVAVAEVEPAVLFLRKNSR